MRQEEEGGVKGEVGEDTRGLVLDSIDLLAML